MVNVGLVLFGNPMIVFKFTQERTLRTLEVLVAMVEQRMLPMQLTREASPAPPRHAELLRVLMASTQTSPKSHSPRASQVEPLNHCMGFFSAQKLNMRNAP